VLSAERKKHIRRLVKTKYGSIASLLDAVLDEEEESVEEIYVRMVANDCKVGTAYIYVSEYEIFQSKAQLIAQAKEEGEYEEG
jgi:hypothetical protein